MRCPAAPLAALVAVVLSGCAAQGAEEREEDEQGPNSACSPSIRQVADGFKALFYDQGRVREAYETHVAEDYVQHNPMAQNGRDAAIAFLEPIYQRNPQHRMTVHRMIVEDP